MIRAAGERRVLNRWAARVRSLVFAEAAPINLAIFRLAVFGWLLHVTSHYHRSFAQLVSIPAELRVAPPGYELLLSRIPIDMSLVTVARRVALVSGSLAFVGLFTRTSALVTSLCALYLLGLEDLFGKIYHQYQHLVWFAMLLAVSPSGDALSIDALWASRGAGRGNAGPPASAPAYGLPLRFVWLLIGVIYFFPGLAKLRAGPEWILSDNLKNLMYWYWSKKQFLPWFRIDHYPLLYRSAALATIVFEIGFIACVFSRRLRMPAVAGGVIFHWMTARYLGLVFWSLVVCYTAFVDWAALLRRLGYSLTRQGRTPPQPSTAVVIVGSILLIANVYCGALAIDSWPFCIYPQFGEVMRSPTRRSLEVVARSASGSLQPVKLDLPEGVENRIVAGGDAAERARILGGVRVLIQNRRQLAPGESMLVFEVERSTVPEDRHSPPLWRELLLEVRAER